MRWLSGVLQEVEKVRGLREPSTEVGPDHTVIGELPEHLKKLFTYLEELSDRIKALEKDIEETDSRSAAREMRRPLSAMRYRSEIGRSILWEEIKFEFRDKIEPSWALSLHKGFVVCGRKLDLGLPALFKGMFGEGTE